MFALFRQCVSFWTVHIDFLYRAKAHASEFTEWSICLYKKYAIFVPILQLQMSGIRKEKQRQSCFSFLVGVTRIELATS